MATARAATRVRFGYRRLLVLLRREGWELGKKRLYRLYTEEGLALRRKRPWRHATAVHREQRRRCLAIRIELLVWPRAPRHLR